MDDRRSPCRAVWGAVAGKLGGNRAPALAALAVAGALVAGGPSGCATAKVKPPAAKAAPVVMPWPADAVFAGFPVLHCSSEELPATFLTDLKQRGSDESSAREQYLTTRDAVLLTMNLYLATGSWAGDKAQITPNREPPRQGGPPECRMFELALSDEIEVRLPKSWTAAPYLAPIAMVGYDFEPGVDGHPSRIAVRVAALMARGDGKVLRTIATVARADYARTVPTYQERTSQEVAQELTEQVARGLATALREAPAPSAKH